MEIAQFIDHTLLAPHATSKDVKKLCKEAADNNFYAVCVNPYFVKLAAKELSGSKCQVATVIGFPLGANVTSLKVLETEKAIADGADEIDMVINIGALKDGDIDYVTDEIRAIVKAGGDHPVKVIVECDLLTEDEKVAACNACLKVGAFMIKTSTGFVKDGKGATVEDVKLFRSMIGKNSMGIKASAGIRDHQTAKALIEAGANRLGTSSGVSIVQGTTAGASSY
ncbi:MAG: deoxyribose-phosphate aldolase [Candidatus Obscuribacterales bacterium]|nr:deoxyribose-phosphate aldolase [Candidatus Obscuribacterales bacterium]